MRTAPMREMIQLAQQSQDAFGKAVLNATEGEFVSGRLLRGELESAGLEIVSTELKALTQVDVLDDARVVIASGTSGDANDALLQAVLGYLRERSED